MFTMIQSARTRSCAYRHFAHAWCSFWPRPHWDCRPFDAITQVCLFSISIDSLNGSNLFPFLLSRRSQWLYILQDDTWLYTVVSLPSRFIKGNNPSSVTSVLGTKLIRLDSYHPRSDGLIFYSWIPCLVLKIADSSSWFQNLIKSRHPMFPCRDCFPHVSKTACGIFTVILLIYTLYRHTLLACLCTCGICLHRRQTPESDRTRNLLTYLSLMI